MKTIITGAAGYLGGACADFYRSRGDELLALDLRPRSGVRKVDLSSEAKTFDRFSQFKPELVLHLAAIASVPKCEEDPAACWRHNVSATLNVARATQRAGARLVFFSTAAVYGTPHRLPTPTTEGTHPTNVYGVSKAAGEFIVRAYCENAVVLRLFNIYGGVCERSYVIPDVIRKLQEGSPKIALSGTGEESRDFLHISDLVRLVDSAASGPAGATYNAGTGTTVTVREIAATIAQLMKRPGVQFEFTGPRKGDFPINWADISNGNVPRGWAPRIPQEEGLLQMIRDAPPTETPQEPSVPST